MISFIVSVIVFVVTVALILGVLALILGVGATIIEQIKDAYNDGTLFKFTPEEKFWLYFTAVGTLFLTIMSITSK